MRRVVTTFVAILLAALAVSARAEADADPASDILLGQNVFYPYNPPTAARLQKELNGVVAAAHRAHLPLKVALIGTPIDLGAIPSFFGKPKQYAAFLDQEITFGSKVPLLVVMPDGYGESGLPAAARSLIETLRRPAAGSNGLALAAIAAVPRVAAAYGYRLNVSGGGGSSSQGASTVLVVGLGAVCVALAAGIIAWRRRAPSRPTARRSTSPGRRRARGR
jgi:hypothetical protein